MDICARVFGSGCGCHQKGEAEVEEVWGSRHKTYMYVVCCVGCSCISGLRWSFIAKNGVLMELEIDERTRA